MADEITVTAEVPSDQIAELRARADAAVAALRRLLEYPLRMVVRNADVRRAQRAAYGSAPTTKRATFVRDVAAPCAAQKLYRCDPPWPGGVCSCCGRDRPGHPFVVVSVCAPETGASAGPETYVFACDEAGDITSYVQLDGSQRGVMDHAKVLRDAGYEVESA